MDVCQSTRALECAGGLPEKSRRCRSAFLRSCAPWPAFRVCGGRRRQDPRLAGRAAPPRPAASRRHANYSLTPENSRVPRSEAGQRLETGRCHEPAGWEESLARQIFSQPCIPLVIHAVRKELRDTILDASVRKRVRKSIKVASTKS